MTDERNTQPDKECSEEQLTAAPCRGGSREGDGVIDHPNRVGAFVLDSNGSVS